MKLSRLSPGTVIAFVALFALIASTAYAASMPRNSVTNRSIKKNAVTGAKVKNSSLTGKDVKNNSLTGIDIKESTLAQVPRAEQAERVGGLAPSQLITDDKLITYNRHLSEGQEAALFSVGPFTVVGDCVVAAPGIAARVKITSTGSGGYVLLTPGAGTVDTNFNADETKLSTLDSAITQDKSTAGFEVMDPASGVAAQGSVSIYLNYGGAETCRFAGSTVVERP